MSLDCRLCTERNDDGAEFCRSCGAALREGGEGSDDVVYRDLAQANLLRSRGDTKGAADALLAVLRRYPNNATAHVMLGDVSGDRQEWREAAQWYELALELQPNDAVRARLAEARARAQAAETSETLTKIGVPERRPAVWAYSLTVAALVVAVGTAAFLAGRDAGDAEKAGPAVGEPIDVSGISPRLLNPPPIQPDAPVPAERTAPLDPLLQAVRAEVAGGIDVLRAAYDPRDGRLLVAVSAESGATPRVTAARAALGAFAARPDVGVVSVVVEEAGRPILAADLTAAAAATAKAAIAGGDPIEGQAEVMFKRVWVPGATVEAEPAAPEADTDPVRPAATPG